MSIEEKIKIIKSKLEELNHLDSKLTAFGSSRHKYSLAKVKTDEDLGKFEEKFKIKLPEGYRRFLLDIGDGGAGPYYGLESLENSLYIDLDYKRAGELLDPSKPFLITEPWNMVYEGKPENEDEYEKFDEEYFDDKWINGLLRICNFGCGVFFNIVVNGKEYGNIWVDDRGSNNGIYPDPYFGQETRTGFLEWYELWLDKTISEIKGSSST